MNYHLNQLDEYSYSCFGKLNSDYVERNSERIDSVYRGILGPKDEEIFYKACVIGYTMGIKYYAIIIQLENQRESNLKFYKDLNVKILVKKYLQLSNNIYTNIDIGKYVLFFNIENLRSKDFEDDVIVKYMDSFIEKIEKLGYRLKVGIGSITTSSSEHYRAIYDAQMTLNLMKRNKYKNSIGIINDFLLDEIFLSADKKACNLYAEKNLDKLKKNDPEGILIYTIRVYCEQGFKKNETSKKLNIHRNTLEYRLKKIEEYMEFPLDNYLNLIQMYIGILIDNTYNG